MQNVVLETTYGQLRRRLNSVWLDALHNMWPLVSENSKQCSLDWRGHHNEYLQKPTDLWSLGKIQKVVSCTQHVISTQS